MDLNAMRDEAYATSKSKGWYEQGKRDVPTLLCLVHSEVSEALEAWRESGDQGILDDNAHIAAGNLWAPGVKPEGVAAEKADVIIRIGDMCGAYEIDLERAVRMARDEYGPTKKALYLSDRLFSSLLGFLHAEISRAHEAWCLNGSAVTELFSLRVGTIVLSTQFLARGRNIDLDAAVKAKMAFNKTRPHRHGGKVV